MSSFTPTQLRILEVLSDGLPHRKEELYRVLPDELSGSNNLKVHIHNIRRKLRLRGEDILCVFVRRQNCYCHVRLLASAYDGIH